VFWRLFIHGCVMTFPHARLSLFVCFASFVLFVERKHFAGVHLYSTLGQTKGQGWLRCFIARPDPDLADAYCCVVFLHH